MTFAMSLVVDDGSAMTRARSSWRRGGDGRLSTPATSLRTLGVRDQPMERERADQGGVEGVGIARLEQEPVGDGDLAQALIDVHLVGEHDPDGIGILDADLVEEHRSQVEDLLVRDHDVERPRRELGPRRCRSAGEADVPVAAPELQHVAEGVQGSRVVVDEQDPRLEGSGRLGTGTRTRITDHRTPLRLHSVRTTSSLRLDPAETAHHLIPIEPDDVLTGSGLRSYNVPARSQ